MPEGRRGLSTAPGPTASGPTRRTRARPPETAPRRTRRAAAEAVRPTPLRRPKRPVASAEAAPVATGPMLSRRVPQAHLAPELRRHGQEQGQRAGGGDAVLPDATEARAALSRYQASRQAARAVVDENVAPAGRGDEAGPEPPNAGGWS